MSEPIYYVGGFKLSDDDRGLLRIAHHRIQELETALQFAVDNFGDHLVDYKRLCEMVRELGLRVPD